MQQKINLKIINTIFTFIFFYTAESCKKKWRSLCDIYRQTLKRYAVHETINSGEKPFKSWKYFNNLTFLDGHVNSPNLKYSFTKIGMESSNHKIIKKPKSKSQLKTAVKLKRKKLKTDSENILQLIKEVKNQPLLWNTEIEEYGNENLKNEVLKKIALKVDMDCKF